MRTLINWDDAGEAELISMYLDVDEDEAVVTLSREELLSQANSDQEWDAILVTTDSPDADTAYDTFLELRRKQPHCPIVGACRTGNVFQLARFISNGLRSYVLRDVEGDFVFLLASTVRSTVQAVGNEREQLVAERMRSEIESVRRFQDSVIPKDIPVPEGYAVGGRYEPSQIRVQGGHPVALAGGDYYDVFPLDDRNHVVIIGDAAGHGMRACMSIMVMHTLIHMVAGRKLRRPEEFVREVNRLFCEHTVVGRNGSLATFLYGVLRTDRHELVWSSAAHPMPVLCTSDGEIEPIAHVAASGPPLGVSSTYGYESFTSKIPPGSRLLFFTDGLIEAHAEGTPHRMFGLEGVANTLRRTQSQPLETALDALMDDSHAFTEEAGRHDDTSVLLLERSS